jgi:ribose transport system ATP-binding protein
MLAPDDLPLAVGRVSVIPGAPRPAVIIGRERQVTAGEALLEIEHVTKDYPGVRALDDVSLAVRRGEVMALLGENGAGKSTLMKILGGAEYRDSGTIRIHGVEAPDRYSPLEARHLGIAEIFQELSLLPSLTVAENIYLTKEPIRVKGLRIIDFARMRKDAHNQLSILHADHIDVNARVESLSLPEQQMVEIAKALASDCSVLIMDEPTTSLTWSETEQLFSVIDALKEQDVTIIYISHRLDEVFRVADRATVLRDGAIVGTVDTAHTDMGEIVTMMTGRRMEDISGRSRNAGSEHHVELLRVDGIGDGERVKDVSFVLHEDEVLGVAGLVGAGRTELARMIFGADERRGGEISMSGAPIRIASPGQALHQGIGYLSEKRKEEGLNLGLAIDHNIVLTDLEKVSRFGFISRSGARDAAQKLIDLLKIKGKTGNLASSMSGGNQQKVVIAKWLHAGCRVLIFDEPTRGIDVAAKGEVHGIIRDFARQGRGAIVISSEVEDLLAVCDRVLVMSRGVITASLSSQEISKDALVRQVTNVQ